MTAIKYTLSPIKTEKSFLQAYPVLIQLADMEMEGHKITPRKAWNDYKKAMKQNFTLYAASSANDVLAVFAVRILFDPLNGSKPYAIINDLVVEEDYRGLGLGTRLLKDAEKIAAKAGCGSSIINVLKTNKRARKLYEGLGYDKPVAEIMIKNLKKR